MPIKLNKLPDIITSFPFYADKKEISFAFLPFCPFLPLSFLWVLLVPVILSNIVGINYFCMTNVSWGWFNFPSVYFSIIFLVQCASSSSSSFSTPLPPPQSKNFLLLATNSSPSQSGEVNFDFGDTAHCNNMQSPQATTKTNYTFRKKKTTERIYI